MIRPTHQDLLRAVERALRDDVLPSLPTGLAQRQLRAAIHIVRRLAAVGERTSAYLAEDNRDIAATLSQLSDSLGDAGDVIRSGLAALVQETPTSSLRVLEDQNVELQQLLIATEELIESALLADSAREEPRRRLRRLHRRMLQREAVATGVERANE